MRKSQVLLALLYIFAATPLLAQSSDFYVGVDTPNQTTNFFSGTNLYSNTYIGYDTNASNNSLIVSNTGTLLTNTENLLVGFLGNNNSMTVTDGGMAVDSTAIVGVLSSGNSVLVTGANAAWSNSEILAIGLLGSENTMTISNGGTVSDFDGYIGYETTSSNNVVTVTTSGSHWNNAGDLYVGYNGSENTLIMANGGDASSGGNTYIGFNASASNNSMTVSERSTYFAQGNFYVGYFGSGNTLTINSGAGIGGWFGGGGNAYIGYDTNSFNNSAIINDGGWNIATNLYVGYSGSSNAMTITNGGLVHNSGNGYIGYEISSSNNSVTVTGIGSLWTNGDNLYVGLSNGGNGSLIIDDGGQVTASNIIIQNGLLQIGAHSASNPLLNSTLTLGGGTESATLNLLTNISIANMNWNSNSFLALSAPHASITITNTLNNAIGTNGVGEAVFDFNSYSTVGTNVVVSFLNQNGFSDSSDFSALTWGRNDTNWSFILTSSNIKAIFNQKTYLGTDLYAGNNTSENITDLYDSNYSYNYSNTYVGYDSSSSNNALNIANNGTILSNSATLYIGFNGSSNQMTIFNGGQVFDQVGSIGAYGSSSSDNSVIVTGTGSLWSNSDSLLIGQSTSGNSFTISNGGSVIANYAYFGGDGSSSNNSVLVTGAGSTWTLNDFFYMDSAGSGNTLTISNGGTISNSTGIIGTFGSNNLVQVTGTGSTYNNSLYFYLGYYGSDNTLIISSGGTVTDNTGRVGAFLGSSNNTAEITGVGSSWHNTSLQVGDDGSQNSVIVYNGGIITDFYGYIGQSTNASNNSVLVTGAGSLWTNTELSIGYSGSENTLTISNGGIVTDVNGYIGAFDTSSNNSVTVTGAGSLWTNTILYIGHRGGNGSLFIDNRGEVIANQIFIQNGLLQIGARSSSNPLGNSAIVLGGTNTTATLSLLSDITIASLDWGSNGILSPTAGLTNSSIQALTISGLMSNLDGNGGSIDFGNYSTIGTSRIITFGSQSGFSSNSFTALNHGVIDTNWNVTTTRNQVIATFTQSIDTNINLYVGITNGNNVTDLYDSNRSYNYSNTYIGYDTNASNNILNVANNGVVLNITNNIYIGYEGSSNKMFIFNEGIVRSLSGYIGYATNSSNNLVIVSSGASWEMSGDLHVGPNSSGNMLIISNATVVDSTAFIGGNESGGISSSNTVLVTGTNASWNNNYRIKVGYGNDNTLMISDGATVFVASFTAIGEGVDSSHNKMILSGSNTTLTSGLNIVVGDNTGSNNELIIEKGAKVFGTADVYPSGVGFAGNNSSLVITGNESLWSNAGITYISAGGSATATLSDGGTLEARRIIIGSGSSGILNIGSFAGNDMAGHIKTPILELDNAILNFNQINETKVTSSITGAGFIKQLGAGTTILSGDNSSFNGNTTISRGKLVLGTNNALLSSIVHLEGGTLALTNNNNATIASLDWGSGAIELTPASETLTITGGMTNTGDGGTFSIPLLLNNETNTLIIFGNETGFSAESYRVAGLEGYNFIQNSNSVQGFIATNANLVLSTNFTLNTTLYVASLTIAPPGSLNGTGTLVGALTNNGLFAPGYPTGTFTVNGNFTQTVNGALQINVESSTTYGNLQVNGNVYLGGCIKILPANNTPLTYGEKLTIINSTGSIKGEPDSILIDQPYCRGRFQIIGDPQVIVTIAPTSYTLVAQNQNQYNTAFALNSFIPVKSGDEMTVSTALDQLTSSQYPNAFNQISPALYTSFATMAFNNAVAQYNEMVQRLGNIRVAGVGFSQKGFKTFPIQDNNKKASLDRDILIPSIENHWGVFVDGNGIFANVNINNQLPGYSVQSGGVTIGADYKWNETFSTGVYVGYEGVQSKQTGGTSIVDNGSRFGLFGTYQKGGLFANGIVGGDSHSYQVSRSIQFPGLSRMASSAPTAGELDSLLACGYDIKRGNWTFGPITSLQYTYFGLQPFTESGAQSLDLSVANANANSLVYSLGSHCFYSWQANKNLLVLPQINLSWEHEFLQNPYALNSSFSNGAVLDYMSTTPTRNTFFTGVGVTLTLDKKYDASFFYNASACNPSIVSQNFFLSLGMNF